MFCTESHADAGKQTTRNDDDGDYDEEDGRDPVGSATTAKATAVMAAAAAAAAANSDQNATWALDVAYLSLFSVVGLTLRAYVGRSFGGDCEAAHAAGGTRQIYDFLWPASHLVCVTSTGRTSQHGGALFVDAPANVLGCLIMGYLAPAPATTGGGGPRDRDDDDCSSSDSRAMMPCPSRDRPWHNMMEGSSSLHLGIRTGLCGSLTTFSSWNTQMVLMMDGTANPILGSQIPAALFGYALGLQTSLASYRAGRVLGACRSHANGGRRDNPHGSSRRDNNNTTRPSPSPNPNPSPRRRCRNHRRHHLDWMTPAVLSIVVGTLIGLYVAGDVYWDVVPYYREMWIGSLFAPFGTLCRWKLGTMNGKFGVRGCGGGGGGGGGGGERWFPCGTFLANFLGCAISAAFTARAIARSTEDEGAQQWEIPILNAISLGIAGCLSTVSTFAKECVELGDRYPPYDGKQFLYSHGTMLGCCLIGLLVYSPIVRFT